MNISLISGARRWALGLALASVAAGSAVAAPNVSISVDGQISPGVYGRVQIGQWPSPPPLLFPQPVVIVQPERSLPRSPIYMHVPPGHAKNWSRHCQRYGACGQPVYFVKSREYEDGYRRGYEHGRDDDNRGRKSKHGGKDKRHKHDH